MKRIIPEGCIEVVIIFHNDPTVGLMGESYNMLIPDFRANWTETEEMLDKYIQEKRIQIKDMYIEFQGDSQPQVLFSFEIEEMFDNAEEKLIEELGDERNFIGEDPEHSTSGIGYYDFPIEDGHDGLYNDEGPRS